MVTRIVSSLVLAPLFFVVVFFLPPVFLALLVMLMTARASFELLRATKVAHDNGMYFLTALAAGVIPISFWLGWSRWSLAAVSLLLMAALFFRAIRAYDSRDPIPLEHVLVCMFGGIVIPTFLSTLVLLKGMEQGRYFVLLPVVSAFLTDAGAYFVGVFFGKHKGITKVSPNKSAEGYVGGIFFGGLFMLLYGVILQQFAGLQVNFFIMVLYGLVGSAITELGDLSFSLIKRQYGIKDYGHLMPGHGGMLDRFDSMSFAAPALWVMVTLFPAFH